MDPINKYNEFVESTKAECDALLKDPELTDAQKKNVARLRSRIIIEM